ncbi:hypothetical protein HZF08_26535 [Paenibacillus sp. CGMCC 1.16610]|uniref:CopG family transcriptional regulator n=1 Tax=Paenibacillus anseongense TaxID=2682845 RepID=A0ABW9U561_9BACL|nr:MULTISPECIES: hypothetical protein [Paenibacillus]MBA2941852.1 hypothetical protein [Paenibacillus sp. CGMCC 1.16610]MVQ34370.1 hypothetical protein [Paenibacillus anseongense]
MKKRRSTVYVRSGKDVTLYIPSDTPTEVIDYLNQLKMDGYFSQGIIDILTKYVREERLSASATTEIEIFPGKEMFHDIDKVSPPAGIEEIDPKVELDEPLEPTQATGAEGEQKKFSLAQIFRQSRQNSGKLVPTSDHGREPE